MEEILIYLETAEDPRQEWKVVHALKDVVAVVLFGMLANADDWQEIEIFARANEELLKKCALPEAVDRAWCQETNETARGEEKRGITREFERTRVFRTQPVQTIDIPSEV